MNFYFAFQFYSVPVMQGSKKVGSA
jgi:hypothetical protein